VAAATSTFRPAWTGCTARGVRTEGVRVKFFVHGRAVTAAAAACAVACLVPLGPGLHAQPAEPSAAGGVPRIVVTGAREPLAADRLVGDVVVIDAATLRDSTADSLGDLLRREAGLQLSRAGGPGQGSGVLVRGAAAGQTVVLVDGVRLGSATLGLTALEQLSLAQVERIEVLRGPGSTLHGADAIGGVVQVFTRRADGPDALQLHLATGSLASRQASAAWAGSRGAWDLSASLADERSAGVSALRPGDRFGNYNPDADGYRLGSAHLRLGWQPAAGHRVGLMLLHTTLNSQYDAAEYPPPTYAPDPSPDFRNRVQTDAAALDWRGPLGPGLDAQARLWRSADDATAGGRAPDRFRTTREQASAQLGWDAGAWGRLTAALEQQQERASSSSYAADVGRRQAAAVLALAGRSGPWAWQLEGRHDDSSDYGGVTTARLGAAFGAGGGWRLRALAGSTFRAPSFNDLHYPFYGVPTLRPEHGLSAEAAAAWSAGTSRVEATVFRNRVRDLIGYEPDRRFCPPDPGFDFGCARNVNRARLQGLSLSGAQRVGELSLQAQADWLDARDTLTGARLPRRAARQASVRADWQTGPWTLGAALLHVGQRPDAGVMLAAETTLDLRARWQAAPAWQLEARLLNVGDVRTEPARDYQAPGRQLWIGVRADLRGGLAR